VVVEEYDGAVPGMTDVEGNLPNVGEVVRSRRTGHRARQDEKTSV
jgi:hypothetical protein